MYNTTEVVIALQLKTIKIAYDKCTTHTLNKITQKITKIL